MSKKIQQHMETTGKTAHDPVTFGDLIALGAAPAKVEAAATAEAPAKKKGKK